MIFNIVESFFLGTSVGKRWVFVLAKTEAISGLTMTVTMAIESIAVESRQLKQTV